MVSMAAVVAIHTASFYFLRVEVGTTNWLVAEVWDGSMRWAVPVFVMISGALFLNPDKKISIRKLYQSNILKIVGIILFWGFLYAAIGGWPQSCSVPEIAAFVRNWLLGHYHMWFLYMIIGLYVMTPILRAIVRGVTEYFLVIGLVVNVVLPYGDLLGIPGLATDLLSKFLLQLPLGYSFYFVLGHWLSNSGFFFGKRGVMCAIGFLGIVVTVVPTFFVSLDSEKAIETFFAYFWIGTLMSSMAIFCLGRSLLVRFEPSEKTASIIRTLSACSLGVYLVHIIVLDFIREYIFVGMNYDLLLVIPIEILLAIMLSFLITLVLRKVPIIGKFCV